MFSVELSTRNLKERTIFALSPCGRIVPRNVLQHRPRLSLICRAQEVVPVEVITVLA